MKKAYTVAVLAIFVAASVSFTLLLILPGYATITGNTYNEDNSTEVRYIAVSLGEGEYSDVVTSSVKYHTVTEIDDGVRNVQYVPDQTDTITVSEVDYKVTEVVVYHISLNASDVIPTYSLRIAVGNPSSMTGTFFVKCKVGNVSTNYAFSPSDGLVIPTLSAQNIEITFYVHADSPALNVEPSPPLDNTSFKFRAEVTVS